MSIQKSRKISDPADHEQPVCKRSKISYSSSSPETLDANFNGFEIEYVASEASEDGDDGGRSKRRAEFCANCHSKNGALLRCRDCRRSGKRLPLRVLCCPNKRD